MCDLVIQISSILVVCYKCLQSLWTLAMRNSEFRKNCFTVQTLDDKLWMCWWLFLDYSYSFLMVYDTHTSKCKNRLLRAAKGYSFRLRYQGILPQWSLKNGYFNFCFNVFRIPWSDILDRFSFCSEKNKRDKHGQGSGKHDNTKQTALAQCRLWIYWEVYLLLLNAGYKPLNLRRLVL